MQASEETASMSLAIRLKNNPGHSLAGLTHDSAVDRMGQEASEQEPCDLAKTFPENKAKSTKEN